MSWTKHQYAADLAADYESNSYSGQYDELWQARDRAQVLQAKTEQHTATIEEQGELHQIMRIYGAYF